MRSFPTLGFQQLGRGWIGDGVAPSGVLSARASYTQRIRSMFGSALIAYYPMWEASGTVITDIINALNGTIANGTRGVAGVGDGHTATSFAGTGYGNLDAIASFLNGSEGTFVAWLKMSSAADWTDGAFHVVNRHLVDNDNFITVVKDSVNNQIYFSYESGNVNNTPKLASVSNTGWFNFGGVWSKSGSFVYALYNGSRYVAYTSLGNWTGTPGTNAFVSNNEGSASVAWKGSIAHVMYFNRALTEAESCSLVDYMGLGVKTITLLGDSIPGFATPFQNIVLGSYNSGNARVRNHAATGATVLTHMDGQVTAAANDKADMVIIELGVNDDNAGNMTTLQAEAEENIAELKTNHPNATIYWMNVLPCWTNNTIGPEVDKSNIRTAIAAACTAQGITCWNTYSIPWITQAQTSDGTHPTAAGHAAIAAQILALL